MRMKIKNAGVIEEKQLWFPDTLEYHVNLCMSTSGFLQEREIISCFL